MLLECD